MRMLIAAGRQISVGYYDVVAEPFSEDARLTAAQVYLRPERLAMARRSELGRGRGPLPEGDSSANWEPEAYYPNVSRDIYRAVAIGDRLDYGTIWRSGRTDHLIPQPLRA